MRHDISKEKTILKLLGYKALKNNKNSWIIYDEKKNQVGYIQYVKLPNLFGFEEPIKYGYETRIDSPTIKFSSDRVLINAKKEVVENSDYNCRLIVRREDKENPELIKADTIDIHFGDRSAGIEMYSELYGYSSFRISSDGKLSVQCKSTTETHNVDEFVVYHNYVEDHHYPQEYLYQLTYCKKKKPLLETSELELNKGYRGLVSSIIKGTHNHYDSDNKLSVKVEEYNGNMRKPTLNETMTFNGTVEEMALLHEDGINAVRTYRRLIDQLLPFKKDIFSVLLNEEMVKEFNLGIFFPKYMKEKGKRKVRKIEE